MDTGSGAVGQTYSFLQMKGGSQPASHEKHTASAGVRSSIIGTLEVTESDIAKNFVEKETEEENDQGKYKTQERCSLAKSFADLTAADYETAGTKLSAAMEYHMSHNGGILHVLEDWMEKTEEQRASLRKVEVKAKFNLVMLNQSLEDQWKFSNKNKDDETAAKSSGKAPQLKFSGFSPHAFHLGKKVEVFAAEVSPKAGSMGKLL